MKITGMKGALIGLHHTNIFIDFDAFLLLKYEIKKAHKLLVVEICVNAEFCGLS